jgi:hypothetical protein
MFLEVKYLLIYRNEDGSKTTYIAEQVSHHPPISAFYSYNNDLNITFEGWLILY